MPAAFYPQSHRSPDVSLKVAGNKCYEDGNYLQALDYYKEATQYEPNIPEYWSNMAACYEKLGNWDKMAAASRNCITVDKNFVKGYYRLAIAQRELGENKQSTNTINAGLTIDPNNKDLLELKKNPNKKGNPYVKTCSNGGGCDLDRKPASYSMQNVSKVKVLPSAVTPLSWKRESSTSKLNTDRSTPYQKTNVSTTKLVPYVAPSTQLVTTTSPVKKKRTSILSSPIKKKSPVTTTSTPTSLTTKERKGPSMAREFVFNSAKKKKTTPKILKKRGDNHYKSGQYKLAVDEYTKCINMIPYSKQNTSLGKSVVLKRATCYYQLKYYTDCIYDCSTILEKYNNPTNYKARILRSHSYEHTQQYLKAAKDANFVLNEIKPQALVGLKNREECHRIVKRCQKASIANLS